MLVRCSCRGHYRTIGPHLRSEFARVDMNDPASRGVIAMVLACTIWGFSPIFFKALAQVPALDVLAHRMIWSLVFFGLVLGVQKRLGEVRRALSTARGFGAILLAAVIVSFNWALFIYTVQIGQTTQSSLGYYIYPLVAVLIGRLVFGEKLAKSQWGAVGLAVGAVCLLTFGMGTAPTLALALAVSFGLYGMLKKRLDLGPVVSVTAEVVVLAPVAVLILLQSYHKGEAIFGADASTALLLVLSGPLTAVPLILFSYAARRLAMTTLGLLQYLNPTLQFSVAVFIFGEAFGVWHLAAFALIWSALALYSVTSLRQDNARRKASRAAALSGTAV